MRRILFFLALLLAPATVLSSGWVAPNRSGGGGVGGGTPDDGSVTYAKTSWTADGTGLGDWGNIILTAAGATIKPGTVGPLTLDPTAAFVFNESSFDADFRVESDTNDNAIYLESGASRVGINNGAPATALDVTGTVTATGFAGPLAGNVTGNVTGDVTGTASNASGLTDGTVVDDDVNTSADIAATKLAYAGSADASIAAASVEEALDEIDVEKLDESDSVSVTPALDGSFFDFGDIDMTSATEGLVVPFCTTTNCSTHITAAGAVAYDTTRKDLVVGNGLQAGSAANWSPRKFFCVDEFLGIDDGSLAPSGNCTFRAQTGATGGAIGSQSAGWPVIGIMTLTLDATNNGAAAAVRTTYSNHWSPGTAGPATRFFSRMLLTNVPVSGGDDYIVRIGYLDASTAAEPTNGAYFELDLTGSSTLWRTVTKRGASVTRENHTVAFDNAWTDFEIRCVADGTTCEFIINGTSFTQSGTQYIPQTGTPTGVGAQMARVGTAATLRSFKMDYMGVEATFATPR